MSLERLQIDKAYGLFEHLGIFLENQWKSELCHFYIISFNLVAWSPQLLVAASF